MRLLLITMILMVSTFRANIARPEEIPRLASNGEAATLIVDGQPYLAIGGELHNSSASSPAYMAPVWDKLARNHVRTVLSVASWELIEPNEGVFDFAAVDDQIRQAQARGMRIVLLWFGGFKNADSNYTPSWVRRDRIRFPRVDRDPAIKPRGIVAYLGFNPTITPFSDELRRADARAFAALMRHLRQNDRKRTVIMVQVENEVGLLGDSRDRSKLADAQWKLPVPSSLLDHLQKHRETLRPELLALWQKGGFRREGTWAEVFGTDKAAEEAFMAWSFGRYVDQVASAGAAEYPLPMYANAWLGPTPGASEPGDYPSGGPVAHMADVWKAAAPGLALLAPDIYIDNFAGVLAQYRRPDNPIFVPEARLDAGNLFVALGQYSAIGFAPFGIEDLDEGGELAQAYQMLAGMDVIITQAQAAGRIRGFRIGKGERAEETLAGYRIGITGPISTVGAMGAGTGTAAQVASTGYGLVISVGDDEFLILGRGITPRFSATGAQVEIDNAQEGRFERGGWVPGRTLNGDERYALFPADRLRLVRFKLHRFPATRTDP